jgi:hypothetical protein
MAHKQFHVDEELSKSFESTCEKVSLKQYIVFKLLMKMFIDKPHILKIYKKN